MASWFPDKNFADDAESNHLPRKNSQVVTQKAKRKIFAPFAPSCGHSSS
jgi:hypothetical protein